MLRKGLPKTDEKRLRARYREQRRGDIPCADRGVSVAQANIESEVRAHGKYEG